MRRAININSRVSRTSSAKIVSRVFCEALFKKNTRSKLPNISINQIKTIMNLRLQLAQVLNLIYVVTSAYMFWKGLSVATNSSSPIVVVLSGSMEPAFQRGDILFLWNRNERSKVGDVVVYEINGKSIPIVHRVLREHHKYV